MDENGDMINPAIGQLGSDMSDDEIIEKIFEYYGESAEYTVEKKSIGDKTAFISSRKSSNDVIETKDSATEALSNYLPDREVVVVFGDTGYDVSFDLSGSLDGSELEKFIDGMKLKQA